MILTFEQKELKALILGVLKDFFANPVSGATILTLLVLQCIKKTKLKSY